VNGLLAYAAYVPRGRLDADAGGASGRVVASFDEDSTTMAVAAAAGIGDLSSVDAVLFASTSPAYLDKTNATAIAAALHLPAATFAADLAGSARSTFAAIRSARQSGGLVLAADVRVGKPGSHDERGGGDAGAALLFGSGQPIAEVLGQWSVSEELLDRWRLPTSLTGESWEERFGFERYAELVRGMGDTVAAASGVRDVDHVVITSANAGVTKRPEVLVKGQVSTTTSPIGMAGAVDPAIALAAVLDRAGPDETVLVLSAVDGCDALLLRTTDLLVERRQSASVADQLRGGRPVPYVTYLSWRGLVDRELPRRPEPDRPAGPPSARGAAWKFGFVGARCRACGFVHLPPLRVCRACSTADEMDAVDVSGLSGHVATYTVDRLAYSPSPPVIDVVVDFEGGGRCALELADADPADVEVGTAVQLSFRRLFTAGGVHNYFWKATVS